MDKSRIEIKVGLFVLVGLVLTAVALIQFSKGTSLFRGTYTLRLHATNVGGIKERAGVLLAGRCETSRSENRGMFSNARSVKTNITSNRGLRP